MRLTGEGYELSRDDQLELFLYPLLKIAAVRKTYPTGIFSGELTGSLKKAGSLETLIGLFGRRQSRSTGRRSMNGKESRQTTKTARRPDIYTAVTEKKEKLTMKIVLTHTEAFPFECYEGNLANGEYAGAYLVKFRDTALPELMFLRESDEFEDCATLESDSSIAEINDAEDIEAWEPVDACEIVSGEYYMPALTRPELLLMKTCLKRGGFNLPLEWREMARQLFGRFDAELKGEIQLGTDGQKTN